MRGPVRASFGVLLAVCALFVSACTGGGEQKSQTLVTKAAAVLHATQGNEVRGNVTFTKTKEGVRVVAHVDGLSPGKHGFHVHEFGDCSAPDAVSAGEHFNPVGTPHAAPDAEKRHVGDLGNLEANESGAAKQEFVDPHLALEGKSSVVGRSVVVHARADDFTSQPAGAAGPRVACGVIGVLK